MDCVVHGHAMSRTRLSNFPSCGRRSVVQPAFRACGRSPMGGVWPGLTQPAAAGEAPCPSLGCMAVGMEASSLASCAFSGVPAAAAP